MMSNMARLNGIQLDLFQDDHMSKKSDLLKAAKREKTFSALAHKEGLQAKKRTENTTGANKVDNRAEAKLDEVFAKKRATLASKYKKKADKL